MDWQTNGDFREEIVRVLVSELSELVWLKRFVPSRVCPWGIVENQRAKNYSNPTLI